MGVFNNFPYTNWHELNLDWFIAEFERLQSEWDSFGYTVTATAHPGLVPNVTVTGDLTNGLNFDFTLVRGDQGDTGPEGPAGNGIASVTIDGSYRLTFTFTDGTTYTTPVLKGPQGDGLKILDTYPTLADLQTAHPFGNPGDAYLIGTSPSFMLYIWSSSSNAWVQAGALSSPSPSVTTPLMDGIAENGSEFAYARGDHVHPTDTSRASASDLSDLADVVDTKADATDVTAIDNRLGTAEGNISLLTSGKQDKLIDLTNFATLNSTSLLQGINLDLSTLMNINSNSGSSTYTQVNTLINKSFTVSGNGFVIMTLTNITDAAANSGTISSSILLNDNFLSNSASINSTSTAASTSSENMIAVSVTNGDIIKYNLISTKSGTKTYRWTYIAIGCTLTES